MFENYLLKAIFLFRKIKGMFIRTSIMNHASELCQIIYLIKKKNR